MDYLLLILEPHGQRETRNLEQGQAAYERMFEFAKDLETRGVLRGFNSLHGDKSGKRVQIRDGQTRTVDGPFIESKEMIGGYFLVHCPSFDDAVELATLCPAAAWATVEVRPVGPCWE